MFVANVDDIRPQYLPETAQFLNQTAIFNIALTRDIPLAVGATIDNRAGELCSLGLENVG